ncbi:hypothetical protein NDU88_003113 [Pleurodeles waltl]|uniref:Uncharacterized protein n=1 Tax=Pleurodeles waltl TaxID=8319 RepID=A0AAV7W176_PLEWA|nr:hypothetical protein NDU88_003113 [Pleurodeles waltl]
MGVPKLVPARDLAWGPARAPELEPKGEASPSPAHSQASAAQGTPGWRKGSPAPGPARDLGPGIRGDEGETCEPTLAVQKRLLQKCRGGGEDLVG